uniref:Fc receptor like A n=1 Tax=Neovison vison TaxID=452646 RepID=A0A8C7C5N4_NEOVI
MLMKISVLEAAEDLNRVTMKLGCVLTAGVLFSPTMLWAVQMLLAAGCHAELFPVPLLRATPSAEPQDGDPVTLSCQTKLPLQRSTARLFYSFYKDSRIVRDRGLSPELQIPTASEAHSGSYWCEAATEDNQVWKQSSKLEIRVQGPSSSTASPTLNPAPQKSAVPEPIPAASPGPQPPLSTPSKDPGFSTPKQVPDPHLHHQMGILLKQMQDMRALLGHLVTELRNLSALLKLETIKGSAKY